MRANRDTNMAVHRIIEANAAQQGDVAALTSAQITLSYRELNQRASAMARHLLAQGFRRGGVATVCLPSDVETAAVPLGGLQAGGPHGLTNLATARRRRSGRRPAGRSESRRILRVNESGDGAQGVAARALLRGAGRGRRDPLSDCGHRARPPTLA